MSERFFAAQASLDLLQLQIANQNMSQELTLSDDRQFNQSGAGYGGNDTVPGSKGGVPSNSSKNHFSTASPSNSASNQLLASYLSKITDLEKEVRRNRRHGLVITKALVSGHFLLALRASYEFSIPYLWQTRTALLV
jgi:hypothetical protein